MVSAWSSEHRLVLGQKVSSKSNEITAIPALLEMLDISGCIVTIDAMGTQKSIAKIIAASSDYILSLKDHPLHQQVKWFETAQSLGFKGVDVSISQRIERDITASKIAKFTLCQCHKCHQFMNNTSGLV